MLSQGSTARFVDIHRMLAEGHNCNCQTLSEKFEVSERTILRDIRYLKEFMEAPVEWEPSTKTYFYSRPFTELPHFSLKSEERIALLFAQSTFSRWKHTPVGEALARVIKKIAKAAGDEDQIGWEELAESLYAKDVQANERSMAHVGFLVKAIQRRFAISISYQKPSSSNPDENRILYPLKISEIEDEWILLAFDPRIKDTRKFLLKRIQNLEILDQHFECEHYDSVLKQLEGSIGRYSGKNNIQVVARFDSYATPYLVDSPIHQSQKVERLESGESIIRWELNHLMDIQRILFSWGMHVTVLEPPELVEKFRETTHSLAEKYSVGHPVSEEL